MLSGPVGLVARRSWRAGWRAHVVLAATAALVVAVVLGLVAGAQRSHSALARLRAETHAADITVGGGDADLGELERRVAGSEGVVAAGVVRELFMRPVGSELFPDFQLLTIVPPEHVAGSPIDRPLVVEGRGPDPDAEREVALSEALADDLGVGVGDPIDLESMSFEWVEATFTGRDPGPADGPVLPAEVVGLVRTPSSFGRWELMIEVTPAFADRYRDQIRTYTFVEARLDEELGEQVRAGERPDLAFAVDADEIGFSYFASDSATQDGLGTISTGLALVAVASLLAGGAAVSLTTLRLARQILADRLVLGAIGWTRVEMARLVLTVLAPWLAGGLVVGLGAGALLSPRASIGLARSVDPAGDGVVLAGGTVGLVALGAATLLAAIAGVAAMRASRLVDAQRTAEHALPPMRRPLTIVVAVRRAIFGAPDRGGRASRAAATAATLAVALAVGALLVGASIDRLQHDPTLSGQGPLDQRVAGSGEDFAAYEQAMEAVEADPRVADLAGSHVAFNVRAEGVEETSALILDARRGDVGASLLQGRLPTQSDEIAVGPATLEEMGRSVGDTVQLSGEAGEAPFRIVGQVLLPQGDFEHDSGIVVPVEGSAFVGGVEGAAIHQVTFRWASGVDATEADRSLLDQGVSVFSTEEGLAPPVVSNLAEVEDLPTLLAVLALLLALTTAFHGVLLTTRLRTRESGTLRALGMTPRAMVAIVGAHALTLAVVALVLGVPLGLAAGRQVWSQLADRAHVVDHPVPGWGGLAYVAVVVVSTSALLALLPAIRAARQRPSASLRAE